MHYSKDSNFISFQDQGKGSPHPLMEKWPGYRQAWQQSPSVVLLEPPEIKSDTVSTVFPSISHEVMGPDAMILVF